MTTEKATANRTALFDRHQASGAQFAEWGDWVIVESFGDPEAEYKAMRSAAGLIDKGHRGRFKITGEDRIVAIDSLLTIDVGTIPPSGERRALLCNDRGGIIDKVSVFRGDTFLTLHCGSRRRERVFEWLQEQLAEFGDAEVSDVSSTQSSIEVRGPKSLDVIREAILDGTVPIEDGIAGICQISQGRCLVTRTPLKGVTGYRIDVGTFFVASVWDRLVSVGSSGSLIPVGLTARRTLQVELGDPVVGRELDEDTTPIEAGLLDTVQLGRSDFRGRRAMLHSTAAEFARRLVSFKFTREAIPATGDPVEFNGIPVGYITSAMESWRHECGIALGYVDALKSEPGTVLEIRTESNAMISAEVIEPGALERKK